MKYLKLILLLAGLNIQAKELACSALEADRHGLDAENSQRNFLITNLHLSACCVFPMVRLKFWHAS